MQPGAGQENRSVVAVIAVVGVVLVGLALLTSGSSSKSSGAPPARSAGALPDVARIARRVEAIRELRFRRLPTTRLLAPAQVRRESLAQLDRGYPSARRRTDEEVLKLLGLLDPRADLRRVAGTIFGEQVAGFYDVRSRRLTVVKGTGGAGLLQEITLAHELTHAVEDQRFGLRDPESLGVEDRATGYTALLEGTATVVMTRYASRNLGAGGGGGFGQLLDALSSAGSGGDLPPYIEASLLFPYVSGARFVSSLYDKGGGWRLVNAAFDRPPASTEQVLHPERYLRVEQPDRLTLRTRSLLGGGWRRVVSGQVGEFDTRQLLAGGAGDTGARAAAGWGGGEYELFRTGPLPAADCPAPCRRRDALVMAWTWDTTRDARQFQAALPAALARRIAARPTSRDRYRVPGGALAVASTPRSTTLAMAPSPRLATLLASRSLARVTRPGEGRPRRP